MKKKKPKRLYSKLFRNYTIIIVSVVLILTVYFISVSVKRSYEGNLGTMERINKAAADYIEETEQISDYIYQDLYRSDSELEDLLNYFKMEPEEYQKYRLNKYSALNLARNDIYSFITEIFEAYDELEKIELIGYEDFRMTECYPEKVFHPGKNGRRQIQRLETPGRVERGKVVYMREIVNPVNREVAGCMIFTFEGKKVFEKLQKLNEFTELVVISDNGAVVFQDTKNEKWEMHIAEDAWLTNKTLSADYTVYTFLNKREAASLSMSSFLTILLMGCAAIFFGIMGVEHYVSRLSRRVNVILDAMNEVTTGNLQTRIAPGSSRDELDMIASNFNEMCEKLELYIQKSYLAEIEKKNAQMQALQSQINPHFLYNTLEAIRMKAICNGDREVGKMLYSMIVLFRSQLKEADIITLGQELDYCKQYMELFRYRYAGSFESLVECSPEFLSEPIIKFVLQPIVENYFIHGIDRERSDNRLHIWAEKKEETLFLHVEDNGRGMEAADIEKKNKELKENLPDKEGKKSIGIVNVNRRIKAVYGDDYGIYITPAKPKGLRVTVTIKTEQGKTHEESHVSRG